jgi:hypothetical protein
MCQNPRRMWNLKCGLMVKTHHLMEKLIHLVVCLTTGWKPLPKWALLIMQSRTSSFKWEYPLLSLWNIIWNIILVKWYISIQNYQKKKNHTSSGLPSQDIFPFNTLNLLNSSANVIRGFYCSKQMKHTERYTWLLH